MTTRAPAVLIKHHEKDGSDMATMFAGIWCEFGLDSIQFCVNLSFGFSGKFGFSKYSDIMIKEEVKISDIIMIGGGQLGDGCGGANYNGKV